MTMKRTEHYTSKMWERHYTLRRGDPMNLNAIEKHCEQQSQVKQEQCMSKLYKPQLWWAETHKCYNCEKLKHLARTCKKPQQRERSCSNEYMHSARHSELNSLLQQHVLNTYEQQRQSEMILTETQEETKQLWHNRSTKEISYSKKAKIKEINTCKTQVEEDYSDSTWIALNLNANSKDVNNWEVNMRLKTRYEHPENQRWETSTTAKRQQKELKKESMTLKSNKRNKRSKNA
jgi:hypothetical protein